MLKTFCFACQTLLCFSAFAQISLSAKVVDAQGEPIPYATIALFEVDTSVLLKTAASDLQGQFTLSIPPNKKTRLQISFVGYKTFEKNIEGSLDDLHLGSIVLEQSTKALQEVSVVALRPTIEVKPGKTLFNVDKTINAAGTDALTLLRKAPGTMVDHNDNITLEGKSSVQVYIDDRPTGLEGEELTDYLKSIPSDQIDRIEIISNPSARYEASGSGGIINIIMKRSGLDHLSGAVDVGYQQGFYPKQNAALGLNYKKNKWSLYSNYSVRNKKNRSFQNADRQLFQRTFITNSVDQSYRRSHRIKLGADYTLGKFHTIGAFVSVMQSPEMPSNSLSTSENIFNGQLDQEICSASEVLKKFQRKLYTLNYTFKDTNDHFFSIQTDINTRRFNRNMLQNNTFSDSIGIVQSKEQIINQRASQGLIGSIKSDYETTIGTSVFTTGFKITRSEIDNTLYYDNLVDQISLVAQNNNQFIYTEDVLGGYAEIESELSKKISVLAGARLEHTRALGETIEADENTIELNRDYTKFFPSVNFTYKHSKKWKYTLGYSKRIDRPSYRYLNPFVVKRGAFSFSSGNVNLNPVISHVFEGGWAYNYKWFATLSYSKLNDQFDQLDLALDSLYTIKSPQNISNSEVVSFSNSLNTSLHKKINLYASARFSYTQNRSAIDDNNRVDIEAFTFNGFFQTTFLLSKTFTMELSSWVTSPTVWQGNFKSDWMGMLDVGFRQKILKEKATISLSFSDVLNTMGWAIVANTGTLNLDASGRWESRQIKLGFNYRFGNQKIKAKKQKPGLQDENKRSGEGSGFGM